MDDLSLLLLDIAENSVEANALHIEITLDEYSDRFALSISDDGCGLNEKQAYLSLNTDYSTKGENRGHGLPLLKATAEKSGGFARLSSLKGKGTRIYAVFYKSGSPVLGDINKTIRLLIFCHPNIDFTFKRTLGEKELVLDTAQIKSASGMPVNSYEVTEWIRGYLHEQTQIIFGGAVDEINS